MTNQYRGLLRPAYLTDGTFVSAELVRQGYAQASTYPPDVKYQDLFLQMQREAIDAARGLWAPAAQPAPQAGWIIILAIDKRAEYVDIQNTGSQAQDLTVWVLVSERGNQRCSLGGVIEPGATLRIWAMAEDAGQGGYDCGFGENIWNNSESDPAVLYANGMEGERK